MHRLVILTAIVAITLPARAQGALVTNDPSICLAASGGSVSTRACSPSLNTWSATWYPRNAFVVRTGGQCLDGSRGVGQPVAVAACNGSSAQDWFLNDTGQIQNQRTRDLCLDVEGGLGTGRRVLGYGCDYTGNKAARRSNQRFYFGTVRARQPSDRPAQPSGISGSAFAGAGLRGAAVIAAGGGNVVASGGGNVVAAGGGNVVSAGGGN